MIKSMCGLVALGVILAASQGAAAKNSQESICRVQSGKLDLKLYNCGVRADEAKSKDPDSTADNPGGGHHPGGGRPDGDGGGFNQGPKDKQGPNQD